MTEPAGRTLDALLREAGGSGLGVLGRRGDLSVVPSAITHDSRAVERGALFCCLRGDRADGHDFAPAAVAAGATSLLVERHLGTGVAEVLVADSRVAMAPLAAAFFGNPSANLSVVGVTGTNGKTTVTYLLAAILDAAGRMDGGPPTGVIGTLSGSHTTPEAPELQARLAAFRDEGRRAVAMEVSSHALAMHRVDATRFAVAVFTNLGRDHLDFHGTEERYFAAKARLFEPDLSAVGVVNIDDPHGRLLFDAATIPMVPFGHADATEVEAEPRQARFRWRHHEVRLPLGGSFNVLNAVAAATAASVLGLDTETIVGGLSGAPIVPGRFEPVEAGQGFAVIVDYAHTPDALAEALASARQVTAGRVIVVFGCGGDRDAAKRPAMGATAAALADVAVVTSDNPRREDPAAIISAVLSGVPAGARTRPLVEPDRRAAIALALDTARPGDIVLVAGKGHETTQTIGDQVLPFDDRVVARELLTGGSGA
jgi:UDP-N-acetylmuramoyl-L-alanyl-D-glutamate--2,6-diaminopimelate ligase